MVTVSFNLRSPVVVFSTTVVSTPVIASALLRLLCLRLGNGRQRAMCWFLLLLLPCSQFFLLHFSLSASLAEIWVSSTLSSSRACSAALLTARHVRRRPRAVRMCGPLSTRIHQTFLHHVMCPFDTSFSSCIEVASFFASTHFSCVVISSSPSCPLWASTSLSSPHVLSLRARFLPRWFLTRQLLLPCLFTVSSLVSFSFSCSFFFPSASCCLSLSVSCSSSSFLRRPHSLRPSDLSCLYLLFFALLLTFRRLFLSGIRNGLGV